MTLFDPEPTPEAAAPGPTERIRMVVAYDGAPFSGFARNEGVRTVAGDLTQAITTVLGEPVELTCAGRTDKGVHARAQVVTFDAPVGSVDAARLTKSLNKLCGPAIAVWGVEAVEPDFDARFSAVARRYRYRVHNSPTPDPFSANAAWHVDTPLQLPAMVLACDAVIGEHDFACFCRRPKRRDGEEASLVRRVTEAEWFDDGDGQLRFEIEASSFCHQMVRSVVGTLVDVGRGRKRPGDVLGIIRSGDRDRAGDLAPPHGLTLWTVRYPGWSSDEGRGGWPGAADPG
ncbi:MAG TPA: tRNA pseudouridine(38-40) synthase TruA [Acidimicrobiales bacterium]|jgi:tRNA pseudouridine38-40 synthase|nr:tRNA pseudouridine(38-40) synthase TruA [Acidimicrobiales bacterium]